MSKPSNPWAHEWVEHRFGHCAQGIPDPRSATRLCGRDRLGSHPHRGVDCRFGVAHPIHGRSREGVGRGPRRLDHRAHRRRAVRADVSCVLPGTPAVDLPIRKGGEDQRRASSRGVHLHGDVRRRADAKREDAVAAVVAAAGPGQARHGTRLQRSVGALEGAGAGGFGLRRLPVAQDGRVPRGARHRDRGTKGRGTRAAGLHVQRLHVHVRAHLRHARHARRH